MLLDAQDKVAHTCGALLQQTMDPGRAWVPSSQPSHCKGKLFDHDKKEAPTSNAVLYCPGFVSAELSACCPPKLSMMSGFVCLYSGGEFILSPRHFNSREEVGVVVCRHVSH